MPTRIISGENVILENYQLLKAFGKKAMIVTGKNSSRVNGSLVDIEEALKKASIEYVIFDEVEQNPSLETIERGGEKGKKEKVDFIIGIGGGSPLDSSKVIGILVKNPELKGEDIFNKKNLKSIDIIAIPTTSGTGSEANPYSIITLKKEKTKTNSGQKIYPAISFLDPRYTMGLPLKITVNTAVDALCHLIEGYLNANASILTDSLAEAGMKIWGECLEALLSGNLDIKIREKLMFASNLAGMVIGQTGTSIPHGMGYALTYNKGVPHGLASGILEAEYLKVFKDREKVNKLPGLIGLKSYQAFEELLKKLTDSKISITEDEIQEYSKAFFENKKKLANHPETITYDEICGIYRKSLNYNSF
jgi:alcohol dehydrogenase